MIDSFDLDNLPAVELSAKDRLPATAGIYFAVDNSDRLLYIGKAQNINKRWVNHHRYHQLEKINKKNTIFLKWYECENDENILIQLEKYFIQTYHPELNQTKVTSKKVIPAEIALRKTLAKISKYVAIYGYEENSEIFGLPTVILKYDILNRNPARILRNIFDGDNRRGSLRWSKILGLEKADYLAERIDAAPKWFKTHKVAARIPGDSYRSMSAPISAANHTELEQRLEQVRQLSPLHQKIKFKRQ